MSKEELIAELRALRGASPPPVERTHTRDPAVLIHELQVHQVELEMQNRELREAHGLLEESRSRYSDLYDFAPIAYCTLDGTGHVREINLTGAALLGAPRELLLGKPLSSLVPLGERGVFQQHMRECVEKERRVTSEITLVARKRGLVRIQMVSVPTLNAPGVEGAFRTALIDISALKALEHKLRFLAQAGEKLASSLDYAATLSAVAHLAVPLLADLCIVDVLDEDGVSHPIQIVFADPAKQRHLAEQAKQFVPRKGWTTPQGTVMESGEPMLLTEMTPGGRWGGSDQDENAEAMRAVGIQSMMIAPLKARGRTFGALTFAAAESERRYSAQDLAFAEEIARRAAVAIDNARLHEEARRAMQARENVLAVVSHDLRTPLSVILMKTTMMLELPSESERRSAEFIHRSAETMRRLIDDLLDSASIGAERLSIELNRCAVESLVDEAMEMVQPLVAKKKIRLSSESSIADRVEVFCDRARLLQVFGNLLGNAIKFTDEGGTIIVRSETRGAEAWFSVIDTGPGIPHEDLSRLFDRFWQARKTARLGTGLGLSIAKGIVEAHRGRIWAESQLGVGTTLTFAVPLAPQQESRISQTSLGSV